MLLVNMFLLVLYFILFSVLLNHSCDLDVKEMAAVSYCRYDADIFIISLTPLCPSMCLSNVYCQHFDFQIKKIMEKILMSAASKSR